MAELTQLQKKASDATAFARTVNAIVLAIEYIPNDETSIERAIKTMKTAVRKAASAYPDNAFVRSTRDQCSLRMRLTFVSRGEVDMDGSKTALERAFEIARSGKANNINELKRTLDSEGYSLASLTGRTLTNQLLALIKARQEGRDADGT